MPKRNPTISSEQRAALHELVLNHLAGVDELSLALSGEKDYERAERLGIEYAADLRLLQDIGWAPQEAGESFTLTMPAEELASLARRLQEEAGQVLSGDSNLPLRRQDETTNSRFAIGLEACETILAGLSATSIPAEARRDLAPLPISGEQREVLRDLMTHRLFAAGNERIKQARAAGTSHLQLASEFSQDLRLMLDVGWRDEEGSGPGELTMPHAELAWTLERMRGDAEAAIAAEAGEHSGRCKQAHSWRFRHAADVCAALLVALDHPGGSDEG